MTNQTITKLVLCAALAGCGGSDAQRAETAETAETTDEARGAPVVAYQAPVLPSAVMVVAVELDCPEQQVYFDTGSAELTPAAQDTLDGYAECLRADPGQEEVAVTGMTDPRGTEPFNEDLARERAESVATYLASQEVEDGFHITAVGERGAVEGIPALWPAQRRVRIDTMDEGS